MLTVFSIASCGATTSTAAASGRLDTGEPVPATVPLAVAAVLLSENATTA